MSVVSFLPHAARVVAIEPESADTRTFVLRLHAPVAELEAARPGQFVMLSLLGHGEAAFTLSALLGAGAEPGTVVVTVRRVGSLTGALFELAVGAAVGVRGPFGRGFPGDLWNRATLWVAGGCGLSALKAGIDHQIGVRRSGIRVVVLYGAREPGTRIHRAALARWREQPGVDVIECVERPEASWDGRVGLLVDCIDEALAGGGAERAAVCGPPVMLAAASRALCRAGLAPEGVFVAVERYMKCGTGLCGHCYVNDRYVCTDGPVFSWAELERLPDAFGAEQVEVPSC
jgi:NAD(P)H-flavin reductase